MSEKIRSINIDETELILKNLAELKKILKKLSFMDRIDNVKKLIFMASLLIEKIVFYFQLSKGVEYIGVYDSEYIDSEFNNKVDDYKKLFVFYKRLNVDEKPTLDKLILLRNAITHLYIKYISSKRKEK